jgi:hypothetical protein
MEGDECRVILVFIPSRQKKKTRSGLVVRNTYSLKWLNRKVYGFDGCQAVPVRPSGEDRLVAMLS